MKNFLKFLLSLAIFSIIAGGAAIALQNNFGIHPVISVIAITAVVVVSALNPKVSHFHKAGVENEFWVNYIIERFWKDNKFLQHAFSDDQYVVGGKIVHIPQPGAKPIITKGRSSFPATAVRRTDTDITYTLEEYSTAPTHIQDAEKVELSYSKIDSVLGDHAGALNTTVADDMIIKWLTALPQANVIDTTGTGTAAKLTGQTGNRKAMLHTDLKTARLKLNLQDAPQNDRFALLEENMLDELIDSITATQYRDFSQYYNAETGVIGKLYGFDIMSRSSVGAAKAAFSTGKLDVLALGASMGATDAAVSLVWQKNAVTRALGEVKFFENLNDPTYYGDIYSALVRMGGRRRRTDDLGIIAIRQAAST